MRAVAALLACCLGSTAAQIAQVDGSGTTNPSKFFWKIMETMQARTRKDIRLTYRAVGSGTGQKEFSQVSEGNFSEPLSDFGAGDIPMSQSLYTSITSATPPSGSGTRGMVHVPFCLGAIGVFHSIPPEHVPSTGLSLSPCTLAKIFSGDITTWDDQLIKDDNPDLDVPANTQINVARRAKTSSSTGGLVGYLHAKCPGDWTKGDSADPDVINWPTGFTTVQGSGGMTAFIQDNEYAIGYLDAGHGHNRMFQEVSLKNEADNWLTSLEAIEYDDGSGNNGVAAAGLAAVEPPNTLPAATADWSPVNLFGKAGEKTWPIVLISYVYLPTDMSTMDGVKAGLLKAFIDFVTGAEGQGMLQEFSFNKLPDAMNTWSDTWTNYIIPPSGLTDFTLIDSTTAWGGMAEEAITVKRTSYSLWKLGELDLAMNAMLDRVQALETKLNDVGLIPLHGSGTTNPKSWFAKAMALMEMRSRLPLHLTYRAVGTGTGQMEFVGQSSNDMMSYGHFHAGDVPMTQANFDMLPADTMVHIPFALGAIGVFHSVPVGSAVLQLDACLLAKIFMGTVTTWDNDEIKAQNPLVNFPAGQKIKVAHRISASSSTSGITGFFDTRCGPSTSGEWQLGTDTTVTWPTSDGFKGVEGSPQMQAFIEDNEYAIGYLDAGHGHDFNLAEVALTNKAGQTRTSKQSIELGGVAAAADGATFPSPTASWVAVNLYDQPGDTTWPIVLISYLYVRKDQTKTDPRTAAALKAFIEMILNDNDDDNDKIGAEFGFTPPSAALKEQALLAADAIDYPPGMKEFVFETSKQNYIGMGDWVISSKRHGNWYYQDARVADQIEEIQTEVSGQPDFHVLHGSGTTNPKSWFAKAMALMEMRARVPLHLTYRAVGTGSGQKEFVGSSECDDTSCGHFHCGDVPMTPDNFNSVGAGNMVHIPFALGAIGVFHSVPGALKLDACLLAKIFMGSVTEWNDEEILAQNPGLTIPANTRINVAVRKTASSSTAGFTGFLDKRAGPLSSACQVWMKGSDTTVDWEAFPGLEEVEGSPQMQAFIEDNEYAIGYLDAGHGHDFNLAEVALTNLDGQTRTSKESIALGGVAAAADGVEGVFPTSFTDSWAAVNLYDRPGPHTWPIVLISYLYVRKDQTQTNTKTAAALKAFIDMILDDTDELGAEFGFTPPSQDLKDFARDAADIIEYPAGMKPFAFETDKEDYVGMGDLVISTKRHANWYYQDARVSDKISELEEGAGFFSLHGSGTTNPKSWFAKAMKLMETRSRQQLLLTYRAVGTGSGQKEFVGTADNGYTSYGHFHAGDVPMTTSNFDKLSAGSMLHIPFALGAIGVFHSVKGLGSGRRLEGGDDLKLDACTLAKIFMGDITTWDHADILNQNPGLSVPAGQAIKVAHRQTASSSTSGITGFLHTRCGPDNGNVWTLGTGTTVSWPTDKGDFTPVQGSPQMQAHIEDNDYAIGYLDAGHGHDYNLAEVALANADGQTRTSKEAIALGGVADAANGVGSIFPGNTASWADVNLYDRPGANTWPIVLISYLYVRKDQTMTDPRTAATLQAFIKMILEDPDQLGQEFGFTPPSPDLKAKAESAAAAIQYPVGMRSFSFETSSKEDYVGMGDMVISSKRNAYDIYQDGVVSDQISELQAQVGDAPTRAGGGGPGPAPAPSASSDADDDKGDDTTLPLVLSIVALVISMVSSCGSVFAVKKASDGGDKNNGVHSSAPLAPNAQMLGSPQNQA